MTLMGTAAALGMLKMLAVARFLGPAPYGWYVSAVGLGVFGGILISVGSVERGTKYFPRYWTSGRRGQIRPELDRLFRALILRSLSVLVVAAMVVPLCVAGDRLALALVVIAYSGAIGLINLLAAGLRAIDDPARLAAATVWRGALSLVLGLLGAWAGGWVGACVAEIVAMLLWSLRCMKQLKRALPSGGDCGGEFRDSDRGVVALYASGLMFAALSLLDRSAVALAAGSAIAGSYGLVNVLPLSAQLLINSRSQKVGPDLIRMEANPLAPSRKRVLLREFTMLACFCALAGLFASGLKKFGVIDHYYGGFQISQSAIVLATILALAQICGHIEFHLIAANREGQILMASLASIAVLAIALTAITVLGSSLELVLIAAMSARWVYAIWLGIIALRAATYSPSEARGAPI